MLQLRKLDSLVGRGMAWLKIMLTRNRLLPYIDRFLTGTPFILSGLGKLISFATTAGYVASLGLPLARLGWLIAALMEAGGGALLLLGYRTRLVAPLMALFIVTTAIFFHRDFADLNQNQMIHFIRNFLLMGGLLKFAYFGAGQVKQDRVARRQLLVAARQRA